VITKKKKEKKAKTSRLAYRTMPDSSLNSYVEDIIDHRYNHSSPAQRVHGLK
jgi:hypothetical protein